jgi:FkbM family methyltransferase
VPPLEPPTAAACFGDNPFGLVETTAVGGFGGGKASRPVAFRMAVIGDNRSSHTGDVVSRSLLQHGKWEIRRLDEMTQLFSPFAYQSVNLSDLPRQYGAKPPMFLDIGGNLGYYTFLFAHAGYNTITIEPMPRNRAAIEATLCLNPQWAHRVRLVAAAVGDQESAKLNCRIKSHTLQNLGNAILRCQPEPFGPCPPELGTAGCVDIPAGPLDDILTKINPEAIDVVKVDIEEFECTMMKGARSLFTRYHPRLVQFEMSGPHRGCIPPWMTEAGYSIGSRTGWDENTVWLPKELAKAVPSTEQWCEPWGCSCKGLSDFRGSPNFCASGVKDVAAWLERAALHEWCQSNKCTA